MALRKSRGKKMTIAVFAIALGSIGALVIALSASSPSPTTRPSDAVATTPIPAARPAATSTQAATAEPVRAPEPTATAAPPPEPKPAEVEETAPKPAAKIDTAAADEAMEKATAAAQSCRGMNDRPGIAGVAVTFAPSGNVTAVFVRGAGISGTIEGKCVAAKFRAARIPPFKGPGNVTLNATVDLR